jgi:copper chaperone
MIELDVKEMTCGHCVRSVTGAVKSIDPQASVQVDLERGRVSVDGTPTAGELINALQEAGYPTAVAGDAVRPVAARKGGCCSG